jgi:ketosteroid isomerase-like protein
MDDVARLVAMEEIKQLKARYARVIDSKHWDALGALFTADAVSHHPILGTSIGSAQIVDAISTSMRDGVYAHHVGMPEISVEDHTATAVWSVIVLSHPNADAGDVHEARSEYHEEYQKGTDGRWRISRMTSVPLLRIARPLAGPHRRDQAVERSDG